MHRWKTGEQSRVDAYLEERGLWRYELFACVVQALIELAEAGSDERATLESIQNHLRPPRRRSGHAPTAAGLKESPTRAPIDAPERKGQVRGRWLIALSKIPLFSAAHTCFETGGENEQQTPRRPVVQNPAPPALRSRIP